MSRESLAESMRRYSNIVTEAEQLDERTALLNLAKSFFKMMKNKGREKQVANSPVRQLENIQDLANSFARELGDDPDQWAGKIDDYFRDIHTATKQTVRDKSAAFDHSVGQELGTNERVKRIMGRFNLEFEQLVENTARYARDPYSVAPKILFTKTAKRILEKVRREMPTAQSSSANHLEAVYKELMLEKEAKLLPTRVKRWLAALMAFFGFVVYAEVTGPSNDELEAEREKKRRNNPDIHYRYPDTEEGPNPFDGGTNTTPRRVSGARFYGPDTD